MSVCVYITAENENVQRHKHGGRLHGDIRKHPAEAATSEASLHG